MSVTNGPRRGLMINALTGDNFDLNFRAFLRAIDALLMCSVINRTTSAPPGSPANGDAYIVKATGTGAWASHDNAIAIWTTDNPASAGEWEFYAAASGILMYSVADTALYFWNGTAWTALAGGGGGSSTLAGDTDVTITSPANLDLLTYDTASSKWKNLPASGAPPTAIAGVKNQTASYVLVLGDAGFIVRMNVASANNCTVPPHSSVALPVDTVVTVRQIGAGITTIVAGAGVTINSPSTLGIARQNGTVQLVQVATDVWDLMGDVT
jgi:uncharacterized protein DUF2793